ncbi:hypothetical protein [Cysteiniphilum sp. JM-1]|uniref:hypothetical protein n=1 Tax=Cysteiniphilum sp. JM-1 TaxID=2610891 RepID=UPI00124734DE|nr:hypothetical protein [Cysteiniphilum sp. JM-1]
MAYMTQVKKKSIQPQIKALAKKYGVTCTLAVEYYSTIVLNIRSGKLDFLENYHNARRREYDVRERGHLDLRFKRHVEDNFTGDCQFFLNDAMNILYSMEYYNESDVYRDYFDVAYYVTINIGKWGKPYLLLTN